MKTSLLIGMTIGLGATTSASAVELSYGTIGASISQLSASGGDVDILAIDGEAGLQFGAVDIFLGSTIAELSASDSSDDLDINSATIGLGYSFGGNYRVDLSHTELSFDIAGVSDSTSIQELGFGYTRGNTFARFAIAQGDDNSGLDTLYSLVGGYALNEDTEVSLSLHYVDDDANVFDEPVYILKSEYSPGPWGVDLDIANVSVDGNSLSLVSLGGHYDINSQFSVMGNYAVADLAGTDLSTTMLGVSYDFSENYRVFGNLSRTDIDGAAESVNGISLGVEMSLGSKATVQETTGERLTSLIAPIAGFSF